MKLSSEVITKHCVLLILLSVTVVNVSACTTEINFFKNIIKLTIIESNAFETMQSYIEQKQNEINNIFNNSAAKEFLIKEINDTGIWWKKDVAERNLKILDKYLGSSLYSSNLNVSIGNLEEEFENGVKVANEYWMNKIDKEITSVKENPDNTYYVIDKKPMRNTENYENLTLSNKESQLEYDTKLKLIIKLTTVTKVLIEIEFEKFKAEDIFDINSTKFISELINIDRYKAKMRRDIYFTLHYREQDTKRKLKELWQNVNKYEVPDKEEIDRVLVKQFNCNFILLKQIKNSLELHKISWSSRF